MFFSFIIPCYRSEMTLEAVVHELITVVSKRPENEYEIILVNDASPDNVQLVIEKLCADNKNIRGIEFAKNFGQPSAQLAGYAVAKGDVIVDMDDDGQTPIDQLYILIDKLAEGYDAVYADFATNGPKQRFTRRIFSRINQKLAHKIYDQPKNIHTSSFHVLRRFIVKEILRYPNPYPSNGAFVFLSTAKVTSVPLQHRERLSGKSGYTFIKLFSLWSNGLFNFSLIPLRFALYFGALSAISGFVYALIVLVRYLSGTIPVTGWASNIIILLMLSGIILITLGIVGEYVGRLTMSINRLPQYVIRSRHNLEEDDD